MMVSMFYMGEGILEINTEISAKIFFFSCFTHGGRYTVINSEIKNEPGIKKVV